jgi:hypothetical protein
LNPGFGFKNVYKHGPLSGVIMNHVIFMLYLPYMH